LKEALMPWILTTLFTGLLTFTATNIDDILVLTLLFSQRKHLRPRDIVMGQYLGIITLVLLSLIGALGALTIPEGYIGLLGLVPLALGVKQIVALLRPSSAPEDDATMLTPTQNEAKRSVFLSPGVYQVAALTIGNGADNLGVYIPLFASSGLSKMLLLSVIFFVLIGVWCFVGYKLATLPLVAKALTRYGHILTPIVLVLIGLAILIESNALSLFF
jgi:cadmium resistance transport/sequestration family protein